MDPESTTITSNETFDFETPLFIYRDHHIDVALAIVTIGSIVACILMIYIICKYDILHNRTNTYVANLCLANFLYFLFSPFFLNIFDLAEKWATHNICILGETIMLLVLAMFVFACVILTDWYIITYKSYNTSVKCRASYVFIVAMIWIIFLILFSSVCIQCASNISIFPVISLIAILFYFFSFIFLSVVVLLKCFKSKISSVIEAKPNLEFRLATWYFLCWLPNWAYVVICIFKHNWYFAQWEVVTYILAHMYPMVLFALLYFNDKTFKVCCRNLFKGERLEMDTIPEFSDRRTSKEHFTVLI
ncbi:hypothetical protein HHI36_008184 [Cryptolaemus montrouzieri]|uniref:G-protein coupled receptors family 1 profile domain-containing protein n=1 Tax=Cryptolaemus montrouzieri TaxID=559131 RepID=A0ABD2MS09_9CUCU